MLKFLKIVTSIIALMLVFALPAKAGNNSIMFGLEIMPTGANAGQVEGSGSSFTIASENLPAATANPIMFKATATTDFPYEVTSLTMTPAAMGIPDGIGTQNAMQTTTISVDQVPAGGAPVPYTISAEAFYRMMRYTTDTQISDDVPLRARATDTSIAEAVTICPSEGGECRRNEITLTVLPLEAAPSGNETGLINNFVRNRAGNIAASEPDLSDRLDDGGALGTGEPLAFAVRETGNQTIVDFGGSLSQLLPGTYPAAVMPNALNTAYTPAKRFNVWTKGTIARSKRNTERQNFGIVHLGADYRINQDALVGVIAQFDWASETYTNSVAKVSGEGWMVGPYAVIRLHDMVVFDGRFAYGQSNNRITPVGTYTDPFTTERFLVHGRVTGSYYVGQWMVEPQASVLYIEENQRSYVDSLNMVIPSQIIALGQMELGPKISGKFDVGNGVTAKPTLGLKSVWEFRDTGFVNIASGVTARSGGKGFFGRTKASIAFAKDSMNLEFGAFYDGIGKSNFEAYGGSAKLRIEF